MDYAVKDGKPRRVHREEVDVVVRFRKGGEVEPVAVCWKDGRSFYVDEVVAVLPFGPARAGRRTMRFDVRFGGHETQLYLEHRLEDIVARRPDSFVWWVYSYDRTLRKGECG